MSINMLHLYSCQSICCIAMSNALPNQNTYPQTVCPKIGELNLDTEAPIRHHHVGNRDPVVLLLHQAVIEKGPAFSCSAPEEGHVVLVVFVANQAVKAVRPGTGTGFSVRFFPLLVTFHCCVGGGKFP